MTIALVALFMSLAVCALIGWGFIRVLAIIAGTLRRPRRVARRLSGSTIVFGSAPAQRLVERVPSGLDSVPSGAVETYFEKGRWKNKVQGNSRASNVHESRSAAVTAGREMARKRKVDHVIRNEGGSVQERSSYGNEPRPVRG